MRNAVNGVCSGGYDAAVGIGYIKMSDFSRIGAYKKLSFNQFSLALNKKILSVTSNSKTVLIDGETQVLEFPSVL